jgi:uncharacterized ion transporter superfamily protein YfcC
MKKFPNAFVIMLGVIFLSWGLTFMLPQGRYGRVTDPDTGQTRVVGNSYQEVDGEKMGVFDLFLSVPEGLINQADLIALILLVGGSFYLVEKTGALGQGLQRIVDLVKGREAVALVMVSLLFATAGATIGLQEEIIAMAPILILFCRSMGFNAFVAVASSFGSAVLGAAFSPMNPFAVVLAQKEAELPLMSGALFRLLFLVLAWLIWTGYLIRYARKNRIAPEPMGSGAEKLSGRNLLVLFFLVLTFTGVTYGLVALNWGMNEISASFFALAILTGVLSGMGIDRAALTYVEGMKEMTFAALIMGLASSVPLLLEKGMILDTLIYGLFTPMEGLPETLSALGMLVSQAVLHFPVSSYSGQVVLTMPVLTPLADLVGVSRQVCVLAYQYGAVNMDLIVPTNGALMGILAVAGISFNRWVQFVWKPLLLLLALGATAIVVGVATGF